MIHHTISTVNTLIAARPPISQPKTQLEAFECAIGVQGRAQESRGQLEAGSGPFAAKDLNEDDKAHIRNLSDSLNLHEEICMNLLSLAHDEGRPVTAEHAAHIYLEERCNLLQAFNSMLHIRLGYLSTSDPGSSDVVGQLLKHLFSDKVVAQAGCTLLARLCVLAQVRSPCMCSLSLCTV